MGWFVCFLRHIHKRKLFLRWISEAWTRLFVVDVMLFPRMLMICRGKKKQDIANENLELGGVGFQQSTSQLWSESDPKVEESTKDSIGCFQAKIKLVGLFAKDNFHHMTRKGKILLSFKPKKHGFARGFMAEVTTPRVAVLVGFFQGPVVFSSPDKCSTATLHKTAILPLKRWGWKTQFLLGNSNFQGRSKVSSLQLLSVLSSVPAPVLFHGFRLIQKGHENSTNEELKSLKRHLLLHGRNMSKKIVAVWFTLPSFPWFDKVLWCPNGWFETMRDWISTCPSPVSQILAFWYITVISNQFGLCGSCSFSMFYPKKTDGQQAFTPEVSEKPGAPGSVDVAAWQPGNQKISGASK